MASNRTMMLALGKGKKPPVEDDENEDGDEYEADDDATEAADGDEKKAAFLDMCKSIKAGKLDEAWDCWNDLQEL